MLLPAAVIGYNYYKNTGLNFGYKLFVIYIVVALILQSIISTLSLLSIPNVNVARIYLVLELLLLGGMLLVFQNGRKSFKLRNIFILAGIPIITDMLFGKLGQVPCAMLIINCLVLTLIGTSTLLGLRFFGNAKSEWKIYVVVGILIYSINNAMAFGFIELVPTFAYNLHAVLIVVQNILFTKGAICYRRAQ